MPAHLHAHNEFGLINSSNVPFSPTLTNLDPQKFINLILLAVLVPVLCHGPSKTATSGDYQAVTPENWLQPSSTAVIQAIPLAAGGNANNEPVPVPVLYWVRQWMPCR